MEVEQPHAFGKVQVDAGEVGFEGPQDGDGVAVVAEVDPASDIRWAVACVGAGPGMQAVEDGTWQCQRRPEGGQEINLQFGVGVERLVGDDGSQGVGDYDTRLPFGDRGGDMLARLGARGGSSVAR